MNARIDITNVSLTLEGKAILQDVDLALEERRIGVIGCNGSGKSTLARVVCGLIQTDTGNVCVNGKDVCGDRREALCEVGIIFQNPDHQIIFPTVEEDVAFGLKQLGHSKAEAKRLTHDMLALFGAADWAGQPIASLSQGQKHLVCLMSVLAMQPSVIVLDEPFTGLDLPTTRDLTRVLSGLNQTLFHVTHDLTAIAKYDRVIWLEDGRVTADGPPHLVISQYIAAVDEMERADAVTNLAS